MGDQGQLRVAVIDNDSGFERVLAKRMDSAGWEYRMLRFGPPPEELVALKLHAVVIDPVAVGEDSWEYLERIAVTIPSLGIVVCTLHSTVAQRVRALRLGVDDFVVKPCHPEEVMARVEAVTRRHRGRRVEETQGPLVLGEVEVRPDQFQAFVAGRSLELTRREFELLNVLARQGGRVIEREDIYRRVWGYAMARGDRSVDVFIRKLRQKLSSCSPGWEYIHTHFGVGYRFEPRSLESPPSAPSDGQVEVPEPAEADTPSHVVHR